MTLDVTVLTPTIGCRSPMLAMAAASVAAQTHSARHVVELDMFGDGPAATRNSLLERIDSEWIVFLDDDDTLDPTFIERLALRSSDADVVIPYCRFDGPPLPPRYCNQPYRRNRLRNHGIFPITVLARRQAVIDAGSFDPADRYEDWALWNRMADRGARFVTVPEILWTYRTGHDDRRTNL